MKGNSLFANTLKSRPRFQPVIQEWVESYILDRNAATLELLQFFSLSSGCKGKITPEMKQSMDNGRIIRELVQHFDDQDGGNYPIIANGAQWKRFRSNFCEFIQTLIKSCQFSIIYDQYFMENMTSFLITLADSQVRAFRHTATLAAMKVMTALVDVALNLSINIDNTQRKYEKTRHEKSGGDQLSILDSKRTELDENMKDIQTILGYLFKSIFVHRYKDIVPEIRSLCMSEISVWMQKLPNYFLDDSHLKYIGWTIYDKESDVRLKCVQALLPLYETDEIVQKMELFTNKYKDRLVSMTMDKDPEVSVNTVRLLIKIFKHFRYVMTTEDCEKIYMLVYTTNRSVAQAAGEFLIDKLFQVSEESFRSDLCSRRGKKLSPFTPQIKDLVTFFIECEAHEHCAYLVDSLIENHAMMKDWECMTDLLLEEPNTQEESLGEKQETVLIDLMSCAVKQVASGEPPTDRILKKSKTLARDIIAQNEEKEKILHFSSVIPDLLRKYKTHEDKVINLLEIPLHFVNNTYSQNQDDLDALLSVISEIVEIHSETEVIESCARVYEFMQNENFSHYRFVRVEVSAQLDKLLQKYRAALESLCEGQDDEFETIAFVTNKIAPIVACCHQMDITEVWDLFFEKWIKDFKPIEYYSTQFSDEATKNAITICFHILTWKVHLTSNGKRSDLRLEHSKIVDFINEAFILLDQSNQLLTDEVFLVLCDIFIIFSPHLANDYPALPELICLPSKLQAERLVNYIESTVFICDDQKDQTQDESQIQDTGEKLYRKRHLLAGFCKLVIYNVIPMRYAICILRHYVDFFNDFGDIIKATLSRLREINRVICAKTMINSLIQIFRELKENNVEQPSEIFTIQNEEFAGLKELAKRFAMTFGLDNQKNRDAIAALHREGIHFAFEVDYQNYPHSCPPNFPFFVILSEFSNKIYKQDKKTVLAYLDKFISNIDVDMDMDEWQPLVIYKNGLAQVNSDISLNH